MIDEVFGEEDSKEVFLGRNPRVVKKEDYLLCYDYTVMSGETFPTLLFRDEEEGKWIECIVDAYQEHWDYQYDSHVEHLFRNNNLFDLHKKYFPEEVEDDYEEEEEDHTFLFAIIVAIVLIIFLSSIAL